MGDFNVDTLKDNNHGKNKQKILDFVDKVKLKSQFNESTTKVGFQFDHIWANVPRNECKYTLIEEYWLDCHKLIYIAFKLPNALPMYNGKAIIISISLKCSV